jgi:serine/threonine-protein kinase
MGSSDDDFDSARTLPAAARATAAPRETQESSHDAPILAGRYELLALLGVGGMGAVYRARDIELDELVAIKMLRRDLLAVSGMLERFRLEVKLARKVTSPHVARTFDIGEHGGDKFLTMELVDGESLASEIARVKTTSVARAISVASDICSGLAAAHGAGVIHRDLKPENVLIGHDGSIKISDFGIATAQQSIHITNGVTGTPAYIAPEQVRAEHDIDGRADLYALGLMMYEMLTGELAWNGDSSYAIASARLLAPPLDVRKLRPEVPSALAELVLHCMAMNKTERPNAARDVAASLARLTTPVEEAPRSVPRPLSARSCREANVKTVAVLPS